MRKERNGYLLATDAQTVHRLDATISSILRFGVAISLTLIVSGLLITLVEHPDSMVSHTDLHRLTDPGAAFPHTFKEVTAGTAALQGQATVAMGLLMLIFTPILRVIVSIGAFVLQRDRVFVLLTAIVLTVLALSFLLGHVMRP